MSPAWCGSTGGGGTENRAPKIGHRKLGAHEQIAPQLCTGTVHTQVSMHQSCAPTNKHPQVSVHQSRAPKSCTHKQACTKSVHPPASRTRAQCIPRSACTRWQTAPKALSHQQKYSSNGQACTSSKCAPASVHQRSGRVHQKALPAACTPHGQPQLCSEPPSTPSLSPDSLRGPHPALVARRPPVSPRDLGCADASVPPRRPGLVHGVPGRWALPCSHQSFVPPPALQPPRVPDRGHPCLKP